MTNNLKNKNNGVLNIKVFSKRESLITELLEVKHFKIIKHVFIVILLGLLCRDFIRKLTNVKDVDFGLYIIKQGFANVHLAIISWICLFVINLLTYNLFKCWAHFRIYHLPPKSPYKKLWDLLFLSFIIFYYFFSLYIFPVFAVNHLNLGIASSFAILTENIRLLMKSHAFVRRNAPDVLNYKEHTDNELKLPSFSNYIYFSFVPTLLYRREYPRTEKVNVKRAIELFLEVLLIIWLESYIYEKFFINTFQDVGKSMMNWKHITVLMVENSLAGGAMMILNFYLLLHAWLNAFAELTRFADRRFYDDWWTSTNYSSYFRSWNIVVHDWLYEYVYMDFFHHIAPYKKNVAKLMVFLLSALIHEHILFFTLNHFVPVLFLFFFCFGATFTTLRTKHPLFNILFLYSLSLGSSIQLSLHSIEYLTRTNCPYSKDESVSHIFPRFITMNCS